MPRDCWARFAALEPWTIQYVFSARRGICDCLPAGDAGLARGLGDLNGERPDDAGVRRALDRFVHFAVWRLVMSGQPQ